MSEYDIDAAIARALRTPRPDICLRELYRQLAIAIGDGDVADPQAAARKLAAANLEYHAGLFQAPQAP